MTTMTIRVPLKFHCVAEVQVDADERSAYVPPPVARGEHHERCRCEECHAARALGYKSA